VRIGDWLTGRISSREFLVLVEGLIMTQERSWLRAVVSADLRERKEKESRRRMKEARAMLLAEAYGRPLDMADIED